MHWAQPILKLHLYQIACLQAPTTEYSKLSNQTVISRHYFFILTITAKKRFLYEKTLKIADRSSHAKAEPTASAIQHADEK